MTMHEDLEWAAKKFSKWPKDATYIAVFEQTEVPKDGDYQFFYSTPTDLVSWEFSKEQWLQARRELGLDPSGIAEEDEEAAIQEHYERLNKQPRYLDKGGRDWIDEFAATATVDEFRGAMKFTIGKYLRRAGKKDALQSEIEKIGDYARRWAEYERKLDDAL